MDLSHDIYLTAQILKEVDDLSIELMCLRGEDFCKQDLFWQLRMNQFFPHQRSLNHRETYQKLRILENYDLSQDGFVKVIKDKNLICAIYFVELGWVLSPFNLKNLITNYWDKNLFRAMIIFNPESNFILNEASIKKMEELWDLWKNKKPNQLIVEIFFSKIKEKEGLSVVLSWLPFVDLDLIWSLAFIWEWNILLKKIKGKLVEDIFSLAVQRDDLKIYQKLKYLLTPEKAINLKKLAIITDKLNALIFLEEEGYFLNETEIEQILNNSTNVDLLKWFVQNYNIPTKYWFFMDSDLKEKELIEFLDLGWNPDEAWLNKMAEQKYWNIIIKLAHQQIWPSNFYLIKNLEVLELLIDSGYPLTPDFINFVVSLNSTELILKMIDKGANLSHDELDYLLTKAELAPEEINLDYLRPLIQELKQRNYEFLDYQTQLITRLAL